MEGSQKIKKGYKFKFLDQAWVIEEIFDNGLILIYLENNLRTRKIVTLSYFTDEILKESKDIKAANPSLAKYKKIEIKKQFHKLYAKMASSKIPDPVGAAAYILNISRSTGYSWLKELKSGSHLIVEYRIDAYKPKLNKETERLTQEAVDALHASTAGTSKSAMYRTLSKRLATEGLPPVSYTTFCRRTVNRPLVERLSAAQGSQARERYRPTKTGDVGSEPLDLVEVDHWMIDLIVVSERDRSPVGVAYLTLLLDTATRVVLGYYLSLDPPNQFAVGRALLSAFTPKTSLLHHLGIEGEWPCWGVPKRLRPDNAKEFKSQLLQDLALKYRIVLTHARPYHPRDKAKIEAFFGTLSGFMKELPGSTKVTPVGPSSRAGEASRTLKELEVELVDYIVNKYHRSVHSTLQSTPLKVWQSAPNPALTYIPPTDSLLIDVLPQLNVGRQVHPFGVTVHNIKYWDDSLIPLIGRPDKYVVKYDPNNLSSIWLLHETTYIRVRYRDLAYPDVSLKEFQQARKALRAQGHDASDTDAVMAFYERSSARTAASREATQAARHAPAPASISTTEQEAPSSGDRRAWLAAPRSPLED